LIDSPQTKLDQMITLRDRLTQLDRGIRMYQGLIYVKLLFMLGIPEEHETVDGFNADMRWILPDSSRNPREYRK
jgi:hypothetical protein